MPHNNWPGASVADATGPVFGKLWQTTDTIPSDSDQAAVRWLQRRFGMSERIAAVIAYEAGFGRAGAA